MLKYLILKKMTNEKPSGFSLKELQRAQMLRNCKNLNQSVRVMLNAKQKYLLLLEAERKQTTLSSVVRNLITQNLNV